MLDGRLGTCLDTTLTMAAALEQAGINSTIWVLRGHAFLGYWRVDSALGAVSATDRDELASVVNQVDLDNIRLVETTLLTKPSSFADATRIPKAQRLSGDLSNIVGVTDIRQARRAKIFAPASRSTGTDGTVTVHT